MKQLRRFELLRRFQKEDGAMNIVSILIMGIGMVFLAVGFIMFPIVTTATDALLAYVNAGNASIMAANFTGFTAIVGITPLLILLGFVSASVFSMYLGVKLSKGGGGGKLDLGGLLLLGLSMVFVAIGLIILPVALDGIALVWDGGGDHEGLNVAYVGLEPILLITPLLILISFVSSAVLSGFFGFKQLTGKAAEA